MEYDTVYTVSTVDDVATMSIVFNVHNGEAESRQPLLIAALYNNGSIAQMRISELSIAAGASVNGEIVISIPNNKTDSYYVRLFAWESKGSLRPLGSSKTIIDIDSYLREKHIYVTANENSEFKIFMNASTAKGENDSALHTINYDVSKVVPVDLCGFTYENELTACDILNTDTMMQKVIYFVYIQDFTHRLLSTDLIV